MRKYLLVLCFCLLSFSFLSAREFTDAEMTFEYNFSELEKMTEDSDIREFSAEIEKNLLKYPDFNDFTKNNIDKIIKYDFWKKVLILSPKDFLKNVSESGSLGEKVSNFALLQITDDLEKIDGIYHFFDKTNDTENRKYARQQAVYTLFNQSENYEDFRKNLKSFKWVDALDAFNQYFPNHSFVLKMNEEIKKEQDNRQKKIDEAVKKEKKKKLYYYAGAAAVIFIVLAVILRFVRGVSAKNRNSAENEKMSFNEILENAPEMELFRERLEKISDTIENTPALEDALMPFARDYGITYEDTVLISEYINSKSTITVSGIEKLKELCADCKTGVVYSKKEDGFIILCRKDVY
ncbi:MAG: hypothetical protein AB7E04_04820 [Desulfobacteraceae bacterium]